MQTFRVWAPLASDIALQIGEKRSPMQRAEGGWWSVESRDAAPGTDASDADTSTDGG